MMLVILLLILCIAIILVKDINPQVKAVAKNLAIMLGILLVVTVLIGLVGFLISQRYNSMRLSNNLDQMLATPSK